MVFSPESPEKSLGIKELSATLLYVTSTTIQSRMDLSRKYIAHVMAVGDQSEMGLCSDWCEGRTGTDLEHLNGTPNVGASLVAYQSQEMTFAIVGSVLL